MMSAGVVVTRPRIEVALPDAHQMHLKSGPTQLSLYNTHSQQRQSYQLLVKVRAQSWAVILSRQLRA
jgi:hypothetical protein